MYAYLAAFSKKNYSLVPHFPYYINIILVGISFTLYYTIGAPQSVHKMSKIIIYRNISNHSIDKKLVFIYYLLHIRRQTTPNECGRWVLYAHAPHFPTPTQFYTWNLGCVRNIFFPDQTYTVDGVSSQFLISILHIFHVFLMIF